MAPPQYAPRLRMAMTHCGSDLPVSQGDEGADLLKEEQGSCEAIGIERQLPLGRRNDRVRRAGVTSLGLASDFTPDQILKVNYRLLRGWSRMGYEIRERFDGLLLQFNCRCVFACSLGVHLKPVTYFLYGRARLYEGVSFYTRSRRGQRRYSSGERDSIVD
jgi:hypothetical protein